MLSLSACAQNKRKGNGSFVTEERNISRFTTLKVSGAFNVELTSALSDQLTIYADENLMEDIITEVKGDALIIRNKKNTYLKPSNHKQVSIKVPLVALNLAKLSGSGKIHSEESIRTRRFSSALSGSGKIALGIKAEEVTAQLSGSGKVVLSGTATSLAANLSGSGSIRLKELVVQEASAILSGSGSIHLQCKEKLDATVSGSGRIRYYGEPKGKLHTKVVGSGSIRLATE